ncbi:hypothetical protein G7009_18165 [Pseudomonas capeferrum]|uniref:hypothetical protein n=1 Tax=Bacteria TaxID=2 RepID=UPI0015E30AFE|nr:MULTISPECIES: hypothetical protein [Pseudomonas]MBA1203650.1 hypothetical protein [Pseudomonas capeferrum]
MNEQLKVDDNQSPSVLAAMGTSVIYVLIGLGVLAGIAAIIALMIALPPVWYAWARIITHNYTDVTPALWINCISLIAAAWSFGVSFKLGNDAFRAAAWFAGLMVAILIFLTIPAAFALIAASEDLKFPLDSSVSMLDKMAVGIAFFTFLILGLGVVVLCLTAICTGSQE